MVESIRYGFSKLLTLKIILQQLYNTFSQSFLSVLNKFQGSFSSKYLFEKNLENMEEREYYNRVRINELHRNCVGREEKS